MRYTDEVAGSVCSDGGPYAYELVERDGTLEVRAHLVSEYLAPMDAEPVLVRKARASDIEGLLDQAGFRSRRVYVRLKRR